MLRRKAVLAYSAPPCAAPEAEDFVRRALDHKFSGKGWAKNFVHMDASRDTNLFGESKVIKKVRERAQSRLPARMYRVVD